MAEQELPPEQTEFYQWLEELDQDRPLSELVEHSGALEEPQFPPEELDRLEELGRDCAQELFDRDMIPDLPPMDIDERLLEPKLSQELDQDLYASSEKLRSKPLPLAAWHQASEMSCRSDSANSVWKHIDRDR